MNDLLTALKELLDEHDDGCECEDEGEGCTEMWFGLRSIYDQYALKAGVEDIKAGRTTPWPEVRDELNRG